MPDQVNALRNLLAVGPQSTDALSAQFKRKPTKSVEQVMAAGVTAGAGKAMGQDATLQKAPELVLRIRGHPCLPPLVPTAREKGLQVVLHHPRYRVERCIGRATTAVEGGDASLRLDGHVRVGVRNEQQY